MDTYGHPEPRVDPKWVEGHRNDPGLRVVLADRHTQPSQEPRIAGMVHIPCNTAVKEDGTDLFPQVGMDRLSGFSSC